VYQFARMKKSVHCGAHALAGLLFAPLVIVFSLKVFKFSYHYNISKNNCPQLNGNDLQPNSFC